MTIRIAIAYTFDDSAWMGGRNYFGNLIRASQMAAAPGALQFLLVTGNKTKTTLPTEFPNLVVERTAMIDRKAPTWWMRQVTKRLWSWDPLMARLLSAKQVDLLTHGEPLGNNQDVPVLGWLFDFQFMHLPSYWSARQLARVRRRYRDSCAHCSALVVSSKTAMHDLAEFSPEHVDKCDVLHFVSSPFEFSRLKPKSELIASYDLPQNFFYIPNQFWQHKNHKIAIDSLAILKSRGIDVSFVCTGNTEDPRNPSHFSNLLQHAQELGVHSQFKVLGMIPYVDTQSLMANCFAVVNPSLFEGWSTTVEEAKAFGKKLILSQLDVHREQCGNDALYFDPESAVELADRITESLDAPRIERSSEELESRHAARMYSFGSQYLDLVQRVTGQVIPRRSAEFR